MTDSIDPHDGACACGYVRYRMTSDPLIVHGCHCSLCQRQNGSAFAVNALIEEDRVQILEGELTGITVPSPSGKGQRIFRCPKCQVALWSYYLTFHDKVRFIRVGTLDDPGRLPPDVHIYTAAKQPWFELPEDALAVEEYYITKEVWREESLERRNALLQVS